jgi:hypothetical protein
MRIVFDESTLRQGTGVGRSITGVVYLDLGELCFPCEGWNDFAVVIAGGWLDALQKFEGGLDCEVILHFMDGPYRVVVTSAADEQVRIRCVEDRHVQHVVHEEHIALAALITQVRGLASLVASECERRGLRSRDVDALKRCLPN